MLGVATAIDLARVRAVSGTAIRSHLFAISKTPEAPFIYCTMNEPVCQYGFSHLVVRAVVEWRRSRRVRDIDIDHEMQKSDKQYQEREAWTNNIDGRRRLSGHEREATKKQDVIRDSEAKEE
jgi:hypothetical protein